jgi:hypothetical protein
MPPPSVSDVPYVDCEKVRPLGVGKSSRLGLDDSRVWKSSKLTEGRKSAELPLSPRFWDCEKLNRGLLPDEVGPNKASPVVVGGGRKLEEGAIDSLVTLSTALVSGNQQLDECPNHLLLLSNGRGPNNALPLPCISVDLRRTCEPGLSDEDMCEREKGSEIPVRFRRGSSFSVVRCNRFLWRPPSAVMTVSVTVSR